VVAKTSWWQKRHLALKSWWHKRRFLVIGGTNVAFLGIGGTKVDLVEGGKNVVVAVEKTSQRKNVGGKKVAASLKPNKIRNPKLSDFGRKCQMYVFQFSIDAKNIDILDN
jgi:hypothetical protein